MNRNGIITMTGVSVIIMVVVLIWQGIDDIMLAVVTFGIIMCLFYLMLNKGSK